MPENVKQLDWDRYVGQLLSSCPSLQYAILWCNEAQRPWARWRILKGKGQLPRRVEDMGEDDADAILKKNQFKARSYPH